MGYTKRKIRGINVSFLLAGFVFACWASVCAWFGWPRGFRAGSTAGFVLFALAAVFFTSFPAIWARFPETHPVNHELMRYGKLSEVSRQLDTEMDDHFDKVGPFRFTATMLVYDSGHELRLIPYRQIVSAEVETFDGDAPGAIVVYAGGGRRYQWYSTWIQGTFHPEQVLEKIRVAARWNQELPSDDSQKKA